VGPGQSLCLTFGIKQPFDLACCWTIIHAVVTTPSSGVRILIADDHELNAARAAICIGDASGLGKYAGEAVDGRDAIEKSKPLRTDILLLDITMPYISGLEVARAVSRELPATQVLILSQHEESDMRPHALEAGARGYVSKNEAGRQLVTAIESLVARKSLASFRT
jgi:DNA-binding NarL/FixJ family response regulator